MKKTGKLMLAVAGAMALMTLTEASAFADSRHRNETRDDDSWRSDGRGRNDRSRGNVTLEGRVTRFDRERDGYRVRLDRGEDWFFVPQSALHDRGRNRDLRIGVNVRLSGVWDSRGYIYVSSADWLDDDYYDDRHDRRDDRRNDRYDTRDTLRGIVESVDAYRGTAVIRDQYSGRRVAVRVSLNARGRGQRGDRGLDLEDVRRGDRVTFRGDWERGYFAAYRIDSVRSR